MGFWLAAYILHDLELRNRVRAEIKSCTRPNDLPGLRCHDLSQSSVLDSVYQETLRLVCSPISIRRLTRTARSALGETLPVDASILLFHRELLQDEDVWGPDALRFFPERFLQNPALLRSKSFTPLGGGPMLCPGRSMAKAQVLMFFTWLDERFEMEISAEKQFPRLDTKSGVGLGILSPLKGDDVLLVLSKKKT